MRLINTEGMALIGPGSEWLWTALTGVVLALTFVAIYRQLRLQRGAAALEQITALRRDWNAESMARSRLACLVAFRDGRDPAALGAEANAIGDFWEDTGHLVRAGHLDRRLLWENSSIPIIHWWARLAPSARAWRTKYDTPRYWEHFEWLAGEMRELDRRAGRPAIDDEAHRATLDPDLIEDNLYAIRAFEEMRAVIVRPLSTASLAPEPTSEPAPG